MLIRFLSCIQLFLQLDSGGSQGVTQQVTQKVAQHLIGTSTCENIKLLNSVIQVGFWNVLKDFLYILATCCSFSLLSNTTFFLYNNFYRVSYAHQACIYLIKNTVKTVINYYNWKKITVIHFKIRIISVVVKLNYQQPLEQSSISRFFRNQSNMLTWHFLNLFIESLKEQHLFEIKIVVTLYPPIKTVTLVTLYFKVSQYRVIT